MKSILRFIGVLSLLILCLIATGCEPDFYLSESEAAAYAAVFSTESSANSFLSGALPGQLLDVQFNNASTPPTIRSTNLVTLMRNYTTLGIIEGFNHQVQLDRLNGELQTQIERWIRSELQLYMGASNAGARLTQLNSVGLIFLNMPTFAFRPDRQSITFSLNVHLVIQGTIQVDALDWFSNLLFGVNGTYPIAVDVNNFGLNGEAKLTSNFSDGGAITFSITPSPGSITVSDNGISVPSQVKNGVRDLVSKQLSRTLRQTFTQKYTYFSLSGLRLTPNTSDSPSRLQYTYQATPETARPMLHIVTRAADGKLYHMRKTEGGRSVISTTLPFPSLTSRIENEPALFASATDQLELAATTANYELVYAHWRDETWAFQTTFPATGPSTGYRGKPAIVASAPGQAEVFAVGRDGNLWHARRINGRWISPVAVPLAAYSSVTSPPYRDPVAVQSGNKIVVVFVDASNQLVAVVYDMESGFYGQPGSLHTMEQIRYAPSAVASGDGRVDVVYAGQSGTPYHRVLDVDYLKFSGALQTTGFSIVNSEVTIGGILNASPSLVVSSYKQLELIGRGTDNHLYHNHFVGPSSTVGWIDGRQISAGWQGWTTLNGNFSGSLTFESMTAFSAAATSTGKIVVASIMQPWLLDNDSNQFVFHNTFDSDRYANQPWKTVVWRGYEQVGNQRFIGQPALAVTDRNTALMYVSNTYTPYAGRLAESNSASFSNISNTQIAQPPADPVITSSVAGRWDTVEIGLDGRMRHIRRIGRSIISTFLFAMPGGQLLRGQPAVVGYGNGYLEIVATAQNNVMYHWRYQNGTWSNPTQLSGTVISNPILAHLGSGQLVLLALGGDRRLYLWSFKNGTWSGWQQVSTSFTINPLMFGMLAASSWGDGSVDLGVVDNSTGALYHGRIGPSYFTAWSIDLTASRAFTSLGGTLIDTPILTALSPTHVSILAIGTDHVVYSNTSSWDKLLYLYGQAPGTVWSNYRHIGGRGLLMGGVAKLGANELIATGTDSAGHVMISRYAGAAWSQFQPILGQPTNTLLAPPLYRPAITSFGR